MTSRGTMAVLVGNDRGHAGGYSGCNVLRAIGGEEGGGEIRFEP